MRVASADRVSSCASFALGTRGVLALLPLLTAAAALTGCQSNSESAPNAPARQEKRRAATRGSRMTVTIVYDNNAGRRELTPAWGFGCVVQGLDKTILFDTGGDGRILLANMRKLGIEPRRIDVVVISHIHGDHTGGLGAFLARKRGCAVYIPTGFSKSAKEQIRSRGGKVIEADEPVEVCAGAKTTGTLGKRAIEEHGLCVRTDAGWVLITGCAHPGVANMAAKAKAVTGGAIALVMGGFHMAGHSAGQIKEVIDRFEKLGVRRVAPCHCTGDRARRLFKQRFGDRCMLVGVGSVQRLGLAPRQPRKDDQQPE